MTGEELTRDLEAIERVLQGGPQPSPSLRYRVLARVNDELHRQQRVAFWQNVSTVAASILLVLNLSLSFACLPPQMSHVEPAIVASLAEQVRQMQLHISDDEIERQSLLLAAGEQLLLVAKPYGSFTGTPLLLTQ